MDNTEEEDDRGAMAQAGLCQLIFQTRLDLTTLAG